MFKILEHLPYGPRREKTVFEGLRTTKALTSLGIRALVNRFLESISQLATSGISIVLLVSVAEETDFSLALSETLKIGCAASMPI